MLNKNMFTSLKDDWETPNEFFNKLNEEYNFTLDPCSNEENFKCEKHFTIKENGLKQSWQGYTVFCNPPYGKEISKWVEKAYKEYKKGNSIIVMLLPARTDTKWFHNYIYNKGIVKFIQGRIHFSGSLLPAPFPSMLVIYK